MKYLIALLIVFSGIANALELEMLDSTPEELAQAANEVKDLLPRTMSDSLTSPVKIRLLKKRSILNRKSTGIYNGFNRTIYINPSILTDPLLLKKTLLHEIAHAYEDRVEKLWKSPDYQLIAGHHKRGVVLRRLQQHNFKQSSSPDVYEYKSPRESFPVNFEYFITDSEFQCRRPILYNYLKNKFNHVPHPEMKCEYPDVLPVWIQNTVHWEKVDFSRLYQVHYLFASKGDALMSRWGHSMIRLVFCSAARKEKSDACLRDISSHLVVSYRANVQDISINYIKGMRGKYASQAYIYPLIEIIREYTKVELRDLISLPINLTDSQLKDTENMVRESALTYAGKYRFFTTNCATETLNYFQKMLNGDDLHSVRSITPLGLYNRFNKIGLIDHSLLKDESNAIKNTYLFKSQESVVEKAFQHIAGHVPARKLKRYLKTNSRNRRQNWARSPIASKEAAASFLVLERLIIEQSQKELMESIAKRVQKNIGNKGNKEAVAMMEELRKVFLANNEIPDFVSYGIPFAHEFSVPLEKEMENFDIETTEAWVQKYFHKEINEILAISENIIELTTRLKSLL
jgi:hypothetical protein